MGNINVCKLFVYIYFSWKTNKHIKGSHDKSSGKVKHL